MAFKLGDRGSQARVQGLRSLRTGRIRSEEEDERQREQMEFAAEEARKKRKFEEEQSSFGNIFKAKLADTLGGLPEKAATMGIGEMMPSTRATADYRTAAAKAMQGQEMRAMTPFIDERAADYVRESPYEQLGEDDDAYKARVRKMLEKKFRYRG